MKEFPMLESAAFSPFDALFARRNDRAEHWDEHASMKERARDFASDLSAAHRAHEPSRDDLRDRRAGDLGHETRPCRDGSCRDEERLPSLQREKIRESEPNTPSGSAELNEISEEMTAGADLADGASFHMADEPAPAPVTASGDPIADEIAANLASEPELQFLDEVIDPQFLADVPGEIPPPDVEAEMLVVPLAGGDGAPALARELPETELEAASPVPTPVAPHVLPAASAPPAMATENTEANAPPADESIPAAPPMPLPPNPETAGPALPLAAPMMQMAADAMKSNKGAETGLSAAADPRKPLAALRGLGEQIRAAVKSAQLGSRPLAPAAGEMTQPTGLFALGNGKALQLPPQANPQAGIALQNAGPPGTVPGTQPHLPHMPQVGAPAQLGETHMRARFAGSRVHLPANEIAVEILRHNSAGTNRFEIRLDPPELGRIDVRLDVGSDGVTQAHLAAERPETLDLLQRDARLLEKALHALGLKTDRDLLEFSLRQEGDRRPGNDGNEDAPRQLGMKGGEDSGTEAMPLAGLKAHLEQYARLRIDLTV